MKKLFLLLALFGVLAVGCEELFPTASTPDAKNGPSIAAIEEQMAAIGASIPKLQNTAAKANALVSEQESATRGNNGVKDMIAELEERVEALEEYIAGGGEGSWTDTTYATLEMYEQTIALLAELQAEVEALKEQGNAECGDVLAAIEQSVASMKSWVNELLTGYYDIATVDAMFAKLLEELTADDAAIREEVEAIREELGEQFEAMDKAYRDAIREAIEENSGRLSEQLTKEIETVNSRIDDEVEKLNKRLDDIEDRLSKLEGSVADLLKRIQSIAYVPTYDDGIARVIFPNSDTSSSTLKLDFTISPRDVVKDLVEMCDEIVSVKLLYTGTAVFIDLPTISCDANPEQGVFSIVCSCDDISEEFYKGDIKARAIMYISDGNNDITSDYISLTPYYEFVPSNQIWYQTNNYQPIEISDVQTFGALIKTHVYDKDMDRFVITCEVDCTKIGYDAFYGQSNLTTIYIPNTVEYIEERAFSQCINLRAFYGKHATDDNKALVVNGTLIAYALADSQRSYTIPDDAVAIGVEAFAGSNLEEICMSDEVLQVGDLAFSQCAYLHTIMLSDRIGDIPYGTFMGCTQLSNMVLPSNVASIGDFAFYNCTQLPNMTIPDEVVSIGNYTFYNCLKFANIIVPDNVKYIGRYAYGNCVNVNSVDIGKNVIDIGEKAFYGCPGTLLINNKIVENDYIDNINVYGGGKTVNLWLKESNFSSIVVGGDVEKIGQCVFANYKPLKSIVISEGVKEIVSWAFNASSNLTDVELPNSLVSVSDCAFNNCSSLASITIPDSVTTIGWGAFAGCTSLTSVTIGDSVTTIGDNAFWGCSSLTSVTIPDSVTTIGGGAFYNCYSLTSVTIPDSVTTIGYEAFYNCSSLTSVYCKAVTPPAGGSYMLSGNASGRKIYVPMESVEAYKSAEWWSEYASDIFGYNF